MTGLVRRATLLTALGLMVASAALAGVPSLGTSTVPADLNLVGRVGAIPDPVGLRTITVRDAASNPVPNSAVIINFSACTDSRICDAQPTIGAQAQFVNCAAKTVTGVTGATGVVSFNIIGGANNAAGAQAGVGSLCATVTADGVPFGSLTVHAFDQNLGGGVTGADLASSLADFIAGLTRGRSDFNNTGGPITGGDLALHLGVFVASLSASSCATALCP